MLETAFTVTTSAFFLAGILLWVLNLRRVAAGGNLIEPRDQRGIPFGFLDLILLYFFMAVGNLVPAWSICQILGIEISEISKLEGNDQAMYSAASAVGLFTCVFLTLLVYRLRYGAISLFAGLWRRHPNDIILGLGAGVMAIPLILFFQWTITQFLDYQHDTLEMLADKPTLWVIGASWLSAVVVAPICEEIIFRGVLQGWLQRIGRSIYDGVLVGGWDSAILKKDGGQTKDIIPPGFSGTPYEPPAPSSPRGNLLEGEGDANLAGNWSRRSNSYWPMVISSALFGLAHVGQGPAPITLFFFGLVLGYLYRKTGSLISCIVLHMMLNGFTMFWFTLQVLFGDAPATGAVN
ncbi:MAG: lysostaphin resistance A-like protein [Mariniblastus sp.]